MSEEEKEIDLWEKRVEANIKQLSENLEQARRKLEERLIDLHSLLETVNKNLVRHHKQMRGE